MFDILTDFVIVLVVLAALWGVCEITALGFKALNRKSGRPAAAPDIDAGIPATHIAAITAAVAAMPGRFRLRTVHAPPHVSAAWAEEGRIEQLASHRTRFDWAVPGPDHPKMPPHVPTTGMKRR